MIIELHVCVQCAHFYGTKKIKVEALHAWKKYQTFDIFSAINNRRLNRETIGILLALIFCVRQVLKYMNNMIILVRKLLMMAVPSIV